MDYDSLVQAVIRSFHDVELRVELQPISQSEAKTTHDAGTGPERRTELTAGHTGTVYKVHHCEVIPTSPLFNTKLHPRTEMLSGDAALRTARPLDPYTSSLRRYPSSEHSEVLERLVDYCPSTVGFPPHFPHSTTHCRVNDVSSRNTCVDTATMPRAPEEQPTRDRRQKCPRTSKARGNDGRRRENLKSIPSYHSCTSANEAYTSIDDNDITTLCDRTLTPKTTDQKTCEAKPRPVNTTVQATVTKISREVETVPLPKPCRRSIAIPPPSNTSLPGLSETPDEPKIHTLTTISVQTLNLPTKSLETIACSSKCIKHKSTDFTKKKSKSLSDFRLNRDFKKEILEWLDDINDPKIQKIQKIVTKNLTDRLKGIEMVDSDRFKVKIANCVKHSISIESKDSSNHRLDESSTHRSSSFRSISNSGHTTVLSNFEYVIKEWLNNITMKKRDVFQRPVKKDQIHNTFVNRLKHLVMEQSKRHDYPLGDLRKEIMEILNEVPIQVKSNEKMDYICRLTDVLMYRLQNISGVFTDSLKLAEKLKVNLSTYPTTEKPRNNVVKEIKDDLRERVINSDAVKGLMIDLTNTSIDPSNLNISLDDVNKLLNSTRTPENAHLGEMSTENHTDTVQVRPFTVPLTVFMVHEVPNSSKTLGTNMSSDTIGFIEDKDIEANINQYRKNLIHQINRWLSGLTILESRDNDFKQAAVLDFANDIVDRKKYLEFNDTSGSDADELEHLKYLIFKWIKRTVGEENIDNIDQAAELMEMTRNIPVPIMTNSHLRKSNFGVSSIDCHSKSAIANNNKGNNSKNDLLSINNPRDSKNHQKTTGKQNKAGETLKHNFWGKKPNDSNIRVNFNVNTVNVDHDGTISGQVHSNPGPSGLMTPTSNPEPKPSSAAAKLMAEWRPPPVFTPPPPGRPKLEDIHVEFQEYLNNWVQQIPIPDTTADEAKIPEKARLGILKGIWKTITKIKTQPAVYQNQFYYEDVLGSEVDQLLDCLPQTQELKEKRPMLKAQLLEKTAVMNDLVRDVETPDNYKEVIAQKIMEMENEQIRTKVKLHSENPTKMFEKMLIYCILDDFLDAKNYKDTDPITERAYKNKLLKKIQEYMDNLKTTHGKEIEDLFSVVKESDIMKVLSNVSLPSEDSIKQNKDEILLGLEIHQWMKDLPIVKNYDTAEQRHRTRLKDGLIEKLHEMEKAPNGCSETQKRHEISCFLDKVPLEKNQDLKINEMVHDLTTRLKNKFPADVKNKSVAFQNRDHTQPGRLLTEYGSQFNKFTPNAVDYGEPHKEEDALYRAFHTDDPLCSTRIEFPSEEWAREESPDAQYKALFKDRPVSSSMIDPPVDHGAHNAPSVPNFYYPHEMEPHFVYTPRQFNESLRGGFIGYGRSVPQSDSRYRYPDQNGSMMHAQEPQNPRFDVEGGIWRDGSMPCNQAHNSMGQQNIPLDRPTSGVPPMMRGRASGIDDSGGFVSLLDNGLPNMYAPVPQNPYFHRPQMELSRSIQSQGGGGNMSRPNEGNFLSVTNPGGQLVPLDIPACCQSANLSLDSRIAFRNGTNASRMNNFENPFTQRERYGPIHNSLVPQAPNSFRQQGPSVFQPNESAQDGFTSMIRTPIIVVPSDSPASSQQGVNPSNMSHSSRIGFSQEPNMIQPRESVQDEFIAIPTANSPRAQVIKPITRHSCINKGNQELNKNPTENRSAQESRNRSIPNLSSRQSGPNNNLNSKATSRIPVISQHRDGLAPDTDPSEISNQPVGYSTPNQPTTNDVPPNIRERRQIERGRQSGRPRDSDEGEGQDRCHCLERFQRWNRDEPNNCNVCDSCLSRVPYLYPYPYPLHYPYPMQFGPPYPPPHCKR